MANRYKFAPHTEDAMNRIVDLLSEYPRGLSKSTLMYDLELSRNRLDRALRLLSRQGDIKFHKLMDLGSCSRGRWRLT